MTTDTTSTAACWQVEVFCHDCTGTDTLGCFEGGPALLMSDEGGYFIAPVGDGSAALFASTDQAEEVLLDVEFAGPWDYQLTQVLKENR